MLEIVNPQLYFFQQIQQYSNQLNINFDDEVKVYLMSLLVSNLTIEPLYLNSTELLSVVFLDAYHENKKQTLKQLGDSLTILLGCFPERQTTQRGLYTDIAIQSYERLRDIEKVYLKLSSNYETILDLLLLINVSEHFSAERILNLWNITSNPIFKKMLKKDNVISVRFGKKC